MTRFKVNFEFIADRLEPVALVPFVPHALVVCDVWVWLPVFELLATKAVVHVVRCVSVETLAPVYL